MKKMHLICNAHLDPVWLWQWKEGAAEAVSTFRIAADFCENYDGFVFNHNEALLYEWVEEYEPELFERIKKLVKAGRWKIIGGWYLQPDCTMLSGESFLSQIELGRKYFKEKFDCVPETAVNFDPFGHTKGLIQILQKTGFKSYLFMRPQKYEGSFVWDGFADSSVIAHGIYGGYNTCKGTALNKVKECLEERKDEDVFLLTWGIGNHGGGPSKIDLENINGEIAANTETEIIHSTPEAFFNEIDKKKLPHISDSLTHVMVGCYTSMVRIKKLHRELENKIAVMSKMAAFAAVTRDMEYPEAEIADIKKKLAFCQFHDILPGSCIKPAEEDSIKMFSGALDRCDKIIAKSFFLLAKGQKAAADGEIPIMIYNPHPYKIKETFKVGFMLQDQNWNENEMTIAEVFDEHGNKIACQNEKPEATFNLDWVKSILFEAELEPCSMNRFDCRLTTLEKSEPEYTYGDSITVEGKNSSLVISRKTGRIEKYCVDGKEKIINSGIIEVYADNEDPWAMNVDGFYTKKGEFTLLSDEETGKFLGYDEAEKNVIISEDGDVRTKIDAFFKYENSFATVEYSLNKLCGDLDGKITVNSSNTNICMKYRIDTCVKEGEFYGQTAFGTEKLQSAGNEVTYHRWCGIKNDTEGLYVINNSVYGGSFKDSSMFLTLLRTPMYSAHPILDRQIAPHNRFVNHIDIGERSFEFRITASENYEEKALVFNEVPVAISYFPHEEVYENSPCVTIDNNNIQLSGIGQSEKTITFRLFNTSDSVQTACVNSVFAEKTEISFKPYELKMMRVQNGKLIEKYEA